MIPCRGAVILGLAPMPTAVVPHDLHPDAAHCLLAQPVKTLDRREVGDTVGEAPADMQIERSERATVEVEQ